MIPGWGRSSLVEGLGSILSTKVRFPYRHALEIQTPGGKDRAVPDLIDQSRHGRLITPKQLQIAGWQELGATEPCCTLEPSEAQLP